MMPESEAFQFVFLAALVYMVLSFMALKFLADAPYGQMDDTEKKAIRIPQKIAWIIMEAPAPLVFTYCMLSKGLPTDIAPWVLFAMWSIHYYHRAFIYPFTLKGDATLPMIVIVSGFLWCAMNGYLNGLWVGVYGDYPDSWLTDIRFIAGVLLFVSGFVLNKHSDRILKKLLSGNESSGSTEYKIPYGGAFRYVSTPHYLGEIVTWVGFLLASWSLPALLFALMTMANLIPRSLALHQWYKENFPEYPSERKAIIPYIL